MKALIRFTLGQTVLINLVFILLMVVGVFAVFDLPVERYPNVHMGKVMISAYLPGASPTDVETLVTTKIEDALDDLNNVEYIRSKSYRERSNIEVKFIDDTDYEQGYKELRFKVLSIQNDLPERMDPPDFTEINVNEWLPVVNLNLVGNRSNRALTLMAEEMKLHLEQIGGVQEAQIQGEYTREFHVLLDPDKLMKNGLTFNDVAQGLDEGNIRVPAGDFESRTGEYVIVVDERFKTRQQVVETIIRRDSDGSFVTVGDVMDDAQVSYREPFVISSVNGKDSVSIKIVKTWDGNALDIVEEVEEVLADFQPVLQEEGVETVLTQDQRVYVKDAISTLGWNMILGIALVLILIWLVMGFRNSMLTCVGIPFSFLVTMAIMWITGNSLNEITLFSFVLVSGIIVDDAIVVVENIFRHYQEGKPLKEAAVDGTAEVFLPVVAATSTTVAAFLPMLIMTGSTGEFFALVPKAVTFAILASLIECLIILPSHFLDWPGKKKLKEQQEEYTESSKFMDILRSWAGAAVRFTLRFRGLSLLGVFTAFALAMVILVISLLTPLPLIKIQFFPEDYNVFYVELEGPVSTPINQVSGELKAVSRKLEAMGPGMVHSTSALAGFYFNEDYEQVFGSNVGHVVVQLPDKNKRRFPEGIDDPQKYLEYMRKEVTAWIRRGWTHRVRPEEGGPPTGKDLNVRVLGSNPEAVETLSASVLNFLKEKKEIAPYLLDLRDNQGIPNRIFRFEVDRQKSSEFGVTTTQVAGMAGSVLDGRFVGKYRLFDEEVDLRLKIAERFLEEPADALQVPVLQDDEGPVRLGDVCRVSTYLEPGRFNRFNGQRSIAVTANIKPGAPVSSTSVVNTVKNYYQTIRDKHPGATLNFAGAFQSTRESFISLAYAFLLAVLIMYVILATQFQSYLQPMIILSAVIFSLTGVIFGTFISRSLFTVNSFIAVVGVTGVVVNDSLVLIDFMNRIYRSGASRRDAVYKGVSIRLRPILLTTLTTTLGLLPMAIGIPDYSLVWGTMARTFVTGLCAATTLTILIVPVLWDLVMGFEEWRNKDKMEFDVQ